MKETYSAFYTYCLNYTLSHVTIMWHLMRLMRQVYHKSKLEALPNVIVTLNRNK